jgi:hypothetical protein
MRRRLYLKSGLIACAATMTGCASHIPQSAPVLTLPEAARTPCQLPILPDSPTVADLDAAFTARAAAIAVCNGRRDLAVQSFDAQIKALTPAPRPWWRRLMGG